MKAKHKGGAVSWIGVLMGLAVGVGLSLYYAWNVDPLVQYDTAPWQLDPESKAQYVAMIAAAYGQDRDLERALSRLAAFGSDDPLQLVADMACELVVGGWPRSNAESRILTDMVRLYRLQGKAGCADVIIGNPDATVPPTPTPVTPTPTPTIVLSFPTRTPSPTPTLGTLTPSPSPTDTPTGDFELVFVQEFCNPAYSGVLEVYVEDADGEGVPGVEVRVSWQGGEDRFFTGLKPEEGPAYADFRMEPDVAYRVDLPGLSERSDELITGPCTPETEDEDATPAGGEVLTGFALYFRR